MGEQGRLISAMDRAVRSEAGDAQVIGDLGGCEDKLVGPLDRPKVLVPEQAGAIDRILEVDHRLGTGGEGGHDDPGGAQGGGEGGKKDRRFLHGIAGDLDYWTMETG